MEFGAREIMIALGVLVVIAIALDAIRRIRAHRYESIRMPRRKQPVFGDETGDVDEYGSELPSGGARVVAYRDKDDIEAVEKNIKKAAEETKPKLSSLAEKPKQESLAFDEPPTKHTTVGKASAKIRESQAGKPNISEDKSREDKPREGKPRENTSSGNTVSGNKRHENRPEEHPGNAKRAEQSPPEAKKPAAASRSTAKSEDLFSNVIVLHVMAEKASNFSGEDLKEAMFACGLRYGSMKIFHCHENPDGSGQVLFSVANSVNPGTFDLNAMGQFSSPGITLFFSMLEVEDPAAVFSEMLTTAEKLADKLAGNLVDDTRNRLTRQMIEHYRQRIAEFSRARLSRLS